MAPRSNTSGARSWPRSWFAALISSWLLPSGWALLTLMPYFCCERLDHLAVVRPVRRQRDDVQLAFRLCGRDQLVHAAEVLGAGRASPRPVRRHRRRPARPRRPLQLPAASAPWRGRRVAAREAARSGAARSFESAGCRPGANVRQSSKSPCHAGEDNAPDPLTLPQPRDGNKTVARNRSRAPRPAQRQLSAT